MPCYTKKDKKNEKYVYCVGGTGKTGKKTGSSLLSEYGKHTVASINRALEKVGKGKSKGGKSKEVKLLKLQSLGGLKHLSSTRGDKKLTRAIAPSPNIQFGGRPKGRVDTGGRMVGKLNFNPQSDMSVRVRSQLISGGDMPNYSSMARQSLISGGDAPNFPQLARSQLVGKGTSGYGSQGAFFSR
jgi:hypothetical protein